MVGLRAGCADLVTVPRPQTSFHRAHFQAYEDALGFPLLGASHPLYPQLVMAAGQIAASVMAAKQQPSEELPPYKGLTAADIAYFDSFLRSSNI